jgi:hypothetical protein
MTTSKFTFSKFGISENPVGTKVAWNVGSRHYLADVVGCYRSELTGVTMLETRHFNGEDAPDVAATYVEIIR